MRRIPFISPIPFPSALLALGCVQMTCMPALRSQSMAEAGAAVAGSTVGSVAGKQVSNGVTAIFGKTAKQAEKAANLDKSTVPPAPVAAKQPLFEVGAGVPAKEQPASAPHKHAKARPHKEAEEEPYNVPPPPPPKNAKVVKPVRRAEPVLSAMVRPVEVPVPKPVMTSDILAGVAVGTPRQQLLSLGAPSARITMQQDGHLLEVYDYLGHDLPIGVVHLKDGLVDTVDVR